MSGTDFKVNTDRQDIWKKCEVVETICTLCDFLAQHYANGLIFYFAILYDSKLLKNRFIICADLGTPGNKS